MKTTIFSLMFLTSLSAFANTAIYSNNSGCRVEVESRRNGVMYYISQGNRHESIGVTNDLSSGTFVFCDDSALKVSSSEVSRGVEVALSCDEHQNGVATTKGKAIIRIVDGELSKLSIDGQVKKLLGWKQDTKIDCANLTKE